MTKKELRDLRLPFLAEVILNHPCLGTRMAGAEVAKERGVVDHPTRWARDEVE